MADGVRHPKIIHRVWLGPNTPHPDDVAFTAQWRAMYPEWEVIVWDDVRVAAELRPLMLLGEPYDKAPTYVHRADLVMVEAVYHFGGMMAAFDVEPVRDMTPLIEHLDCWTIPEDAAGGPGGAIFGSVPGHPALAAVLSEIYLRYPNWRGRPNLDTGPHPWAAAWNLGLMKGMVYAAPHRAAVPVHWASRSNLENPAYVERLRQDPGVYAIHYYRGSWTKDSGIDVTIRT